jgi:DNA repair exonuclease SbcCD ATPase subunit
MADEMQPQQGSVPSPDPTERTKQELLREISGLEKLLVQRINAVKDKANDRSREIENRLGREEKHRLEQKTDTKTAVDDALTAQKEAATKSEAATNNQLAEIKATFATEVAALRREINDLRGRVGRVEFGPPPPSGE